MTRGDSAMLLRRSTLPALLVLVWTFPSYSADVTVTLSPNDGFVVKDSMGTTDRLRVDESSGNISRNGALFVHTTGIDSLYVGEGAGNVGSGAYKTNTAFGANALGSLTSGSLNVAAGRSALRNTSAGSWNTAVGDYALASNTTGSNNTGIGFAALYGNTTGRRNVAVGHYALSDHGGAYNTAVGVEALRANNGSYFNAAVGTWALKYNTSGIMNTGLGAGALLKNTVGYVNVAVGTYALRNNDSGNYNAAVGNGALSSNTTGSYNAASGSGALAANTTGLDNTGVGANTLRYNKTGTGNAALGRRALYYTTGSRNVAVGRDAGFNQTTGSDNIYLANTGIAGESGQIKIGTVGTHTGATFAGIHNATSTSGIAVLVNASGVLGTTTSSARFKRDIADMGDASDVLMQLRPVVYHYKEEAVGEEAASELQYGLVAEEVAEVAPELVAPGTDGRPYSVRYHVLPAMLLNEVQRQRRAIAVHEQRDTEQERTIAALQARLARLEGQAQ